MIASPAPTDSVDDWLEIESSRRRNVDRFPASLPHQVTPVGWALPTDHFRFSNVDIWNG